MESKVTSIVKNIISWIYTLNFKQLPLFYYFCGCFVFATQNPNPQNLFDRLENNTTFRG